MTEAEDVSDESLLGKLASAIAREEHFQQDELSLDTGERAALARLDPDRLRPHQIGALAKALALADIDTSLWREGDWSRWALIAQGMALAGHDEKEHLGKQLFDAGVSESRVTRLLVSKGDAFRQQVPRLFRLMASRGCAPNWRELGMLILRVEQKDDRAERLRLRIAGDYYSALFRKTETKSESDSASEAAPQ